MQVLTNYKSMVGFQKNNFQNTITLHNKMINRLFH